MWPVVTTATSVHDWRRAMFCPQCGKQLPDNAKFCSGCGHSFAQTQTPQAGPSQQWQGGASQPQGVGPQTFSGGGFGSPVSQSVKPGGFANGKKILIGAAVVVVVLAILAIRLCSGGGGAGRFYQVDSFLNGSNAAIVSELEGHQGLKYKDSSQGWVGKPDDCPISGRVTVSFADEDGNTLTDDDIEDGDEICAMTALWEGATIKADDDDPDVLLDILERECSLGSELDRDNMYGYADYALGKCKVNGQDGFWIVAVMPMGEDDGEVECVVALAAGTLEAAGFDDYDDLLDNIDNLSF